MNGILHSVTPSQRLWHAEHKARQRRLYQAALAALSKPAPPAPIKRDLLMVASFREEPLAAVLNAPSPAEQIQQIQQIQELVATTYGLRRIDLLAHRRTANVTRPRHIAMYLAKMLTLRSLPEIGRLFAGRDHTTVLHAVRKIERLRNGDPILTAEIDAIVAALRAHGLNLPSLPPVKPTN